MTINPKTIDHTNLKTDASEKDIEKLCNEAKEYGFGAICVYLRYVPLCKRLLKGSNVKVCTVIGFPKGIETTEQKANEAKQAVKDGADELDMVINVPALKKGDFDFVKNDISSVREACKGKILKVIIEAGLLNEDQKKKACQLSEEAGADFVKTSTGFAVDNKGNKLGATVEDVKLMKGMVGDRLGIKAAGGIKTREFAQQLIDAGATRIGASASIEIIGRSSMSNGIEKLWWKYFEFHADQRLRAFYYYLIIIGALAFAYYYCSTFNLPKDAEQIFNFRLFAPYISIFAAMVSIGFFFLEVRNVELINTGRDRLKGELQNIRGSKKGLIDSLGLFGILVFLGDFVLNYAKNKMIWLWWIFFVIGRLICPVIKHQFWLRSIYLTIFTFSFLITIKIYTCLEYIWLPILVAYLSTIDINKPNLNDL